MLDDLDLTGKTEADGTYRFGWDGVSYEIDLSQEHAERLQAALEPFVDAARRTGG